VICNGLTPDTPHKEGIGHRRIADTAVFV